MDNSLLQKNPSTVLDKKFIFSKNLVVTDTVMTTQVLVFRQLHDELQDPLCEKVTSSTKPEVVNVTVIVNMHNESNGA